MASLVVSPSQEIVLSFDDPPAEDLSEEDINFSLHRPDGSIVDPSTYEIKLVKKADGEYDIEIEFFDDIPEDTKVSVEFTDPEGVTT